MEFIEKIAAFIPYPRKHRRHYHGIFAPNSPFRKKVAANAQKARVSAPPEAKEMVDKVEKISFNWAKLLSHISEKWIELPIFAATAEGLKRIARGL